MKPGEIIFEGRTQKGQPVAIRYVQAGDLAALLKYINTISRERTYIRFQGERQTLKEEREWLTGVLAKIKNKKTVSLVAVSAGKIIGMSGLTQKDKSESHVADFGITVARGFRNQGVGSLLIKHVLSQAAKNLTGLKIVELRVFGNNPVARRLYQKFGFREFGILPQGSRHREKLVDLVYMYRTL